MTDTTDRLRAALAVRYVVEREIGVGGMATVYLARDVKHDRHVALKLLKPELAAVLGQERFLSEIRVTAHLQHPHILPLFDSGAADGFLYYVMPHVQGESLRQKLNREKQLRVDEALEIARAVASALDYAHRHDVVHRDIKPENILLHDGQPVVADFGISLAVSLAGGERITQTGLSLGTPHYMSPEQATGDRGVDGRSDIYSLAAVLYEMLTGDPPHTGSTIQAVIAKVLTEKPTHVRALRDTVPEHVDAAINQALAKLPADRFATAAQFAEALRRSSGMMAGPDQATAVRRAAGARRSFPVTPRELVLAVVAALAIAGAAWGWLRERSNRPVVSFAVPLPDSVQLAGTVSATGAGPILAMSPDGSRLTFVGFDGERQRLFVRSMDRLDAAALPGTDGASGPFISPDGQWIAFWSVAGLMKVPVVGGSPVVIAEGSGMAGLGGVGRGGSWGRDLLVFSPDYNTPLERMAVSGGRIEPVTTLDTAAGEVSHRFSDLLPGDGGVLVSVVANSRGRVTLWIAAASLKTGRLTYLVPDGVTARYLPGFLLFARLDGTLLAAPFDLKGLKVTGPPTPVLDSVSVQGATGAASFAVSRTGDLAYARGSLAQQLVTFDRSGTTRVLAAEPRFYQQVRVSPDARRLALVVAKPGLNDLWIYDQTQNTLSRLTSEVNANMPAWSPDGRRLVFATIGPTVFDLYATAADGSEEPRPFLAAPVTEFTSSWTPDGRSIVFEARNPGSEPDLWIADADGGRAPRPLYRTPFGERFPVVSPDGRWVAYASDESGREEIYVRPLAGGSRSQVSSGGGTQPRWPRNGRELFYRNGNRIHTAVVGVGSVFSVGARSVVWEGNFQDYDVYPDGRRLVLIKPVDEAPRIVVVLNFVDEVRRKLAAGR